jgi:hypothetical protein
MRELRLAIPIAYVDRQASCIAPTPREQGGTGGGEAACGAWRLAESRKREARVSNLDVDFGLPDPSCLTEMHA